MEKFPLRQVHLDFHTSPDIAGIGSRFDKKQFQQALKTGHLDSITVFAKCHHGLCYYPTEVGTMHPGLDFDLCGAQIEAAHEIGVRAPVYITAGWSHRDARLHPEWIMRKKDGGKWGCGNAAAFDTASPEEPLGEVSWNTLCLSDGSYCRHIYELTEEVCKRYKDLDGLFYDICVVSGPCWCDECVAGMKAEGLDPEKGADAFAYFVRGRQRFMEKCNAILHRYHPDATVFYNAGGADMTKPYVHEYQTHYEMEDLPTCWHGYDRLPMRARFFSRTGKPTMGMTGKFHLAWGEFGGFKCKEALKFEVSAMALYGVACSIGDHCHPDGEMEMQTYENIGYAYDYLKKIEPYCYGGENTARVGVMISKDAAANNGVAKILLENQIDFDVVQGDPERYELVIVPEGVKDISCLDGYTGKVLICADSNVKDGEFLLDCGAEYLGAPEYDWDYICTDRPFRQELPHSPMLCNLPGHRIALTDGEEVAYVQLPYFNRTVGQFCGHKNTPNDKTTHAPGIVKKGNVVYMAHPMATAYNTYGSLYQKRYFMLALEQLFTGGAFRVKGMGAMGRATMIHQKDQSRYCMNLLYAAPVKRGLAEVIEDIMPVYNIEITLDIPETVKRAYLPLQSVELPVTCENGKQKLILPKLECHESIVLEY